MSCLLPINYTLYKEKETYKTVFRHMQDYQVFETVLIKNSEEPRYNLNLLPLLQNHRLCRHLVSNSVPA
jgi:hypothetical protein